MKVAIRHNKEKKGIELLFSENLPIALSNRLKEVGFKKGFKEPLKWYTPEHPALVNYANQLQEVLLKGGAFEKIELVPSYSPTQENINEKKFSYVSISYREEQNQKQEHYIVFDPFKAVATTIANFYFTHFS